MSAIILSIRRDQPILCPGCKAELAGPVGWVLGNVIFCHRCAASLPDVVVKRIIRRTRCELFSGLFYEAFGLIVFSPPKTSGSDRIQSLTLMLPEDPDPRPFYLHCSRPISCGDDVGDLKRPTLLPPCLPPTNPRWGAPGSPASARKG